MISNYILDDENKPVAEEDFLKFAMWCSENESRRIVAKTNVDETYRVSTVFLGVSHGYEGSEPIVFETALFKDGKLEHIAGRYTSWDEAEQQHAEVVKAMEGR